jgi:LruC domain-containing protein
MYALSNKEQISPMKIRVSNFILSAGIVLSLAACSKENNQTKPSANTPENMSELKVPNNFAYATTRMVSYDLGIVNAPSTEKYRIEIYDYKPLSGGAVIATLIADQATSATGSIALPSAVKEVYIKTTAPDGSSSLEKATINGTSLNQVISVGKKSGKKTTVVSPTCNSGYNFTRTHGNSWWNAEAQNYGSNKVIAVTGTYTGGGITIKDGNTVRLCGNGNLSVTIDNGYLEVVDGADIQFNNFSINSNASYNKATFYTNAKVRFNNNFSFNKTIENYGEVTAAQSIGINNGATFINHGSVNMIGTGWYTVDGVLTNNGSWVCNGNYNFNSTSVVTNNCSMEVKKQHTLDAVFHNHGYSYSYYLYINSNGRLALYNSAMAEADDLYMDGTITGTGSTSLFKLNDDANGNRNSNGITGNVQYCRTGSGGNLSDNTVSGGASLGCSVYIPTDACNSQGNGTPTITDTDNDGVADNVDAYPTDPSRASNDYFPSENSFGTLAYEDLWPAKGDFDFNDLVVDYNYTLVKNAAGDVVDVKAKYVVRAIGGSYANGFGIQLNVAPGAVASVTGTQLTESIISNAPNGVEQGQTKATVVIFDNAFSILPNTGTPFVNTVEGEAYTTPDTMNITINFSSAQSLANVGAAPFNPFIFINGERGKEVHLAGNAPTSLANATFFGTADDDTDVNGNKFYLSETNLPWALNIATGFAYPKEKVDIVTSYSNFASWAQSGGNINTDWYLALPGYRVANNIYTAP